VQTTPGLTSVSKRIPIVIAQRMGGVVREAAVFGGGASAASRAEWAMSFAEVPASGASSDQEPRKLPALCSAELGAPIPFNTTNPAR
jgi:hypothetical protein